MLNDLHNNVGFVIMTAPISPAATGTITGTVIDTKNIGEIEIQISAGAQTSTDVTVTPVILSGTVTGTLTSAAATELLGTEAAAALDGTAGAGSVSKIGYIGASRYIRCDLIVLNAATGVYSVIGVKTGQRKKPVS